MSRIMNFLNNVIDISSETSTFSNIFFTTKAESLVERMALSTNSQLINQADIF